MFQYAGDNSVATLSASNLQRILNAFNSAFTKLRLKINANKTKIHLSTITNWSSPEITKYPTVSRNMDNFLYLGSHLSSRTALQDEIKYHLKSEGSTFEIEFSKIVKLEQTAKCLCTRQSVIPTLLHAFGTWKTYRRHLTFLENSELSSNFLEHQLRKQKKRTFFKRNWPTFIKNQLWWSGHLMQMDDNRLQILILTQTRKSSKRR